MKILSYLTTLEEERADYSNKYHYSGKTGGFAEFKAKYEKDNGQELTQWIVQVSRTSNDEEDWELSSSEVDESLTYFYRFWNDYYEENNGEFSTDVYRAIALDNPEDLNEEDLGICWTWAPDNLDYLADCLLRDDVKKYEIRLHAEISSDNVDWEESALLYCRYCRLEKELRLINPEKAKLRGYIVLLYNDDTKRYKVLQTKGDCKEGSVHYCVPKTVWKYESELRGFLENHPEYKTTGKVVINSDCFKIYDYMLDAEGRLAFLIESCKRDIWVDCKALTTLEGFPKEVNGDFSLVNADLSSLKGCPQVIKGSMIVHEDVYDITSLEGGPRRVEGDFNISFHYLLKSLKGAPEYVGGTFDIFGCKVTSLEGCPEYIGKDFIATNTLISSLDGAPKHVGGCLNLRRSNFKGEGIDKVNYEVSYSNI